MPELPSIGETSCASVLVVDDDAALRAVMARHFSLRGAGVWTAGTVGEAIDTMQRQRIDVLVADYRLPGTDGLVLLDIARQRWPEVTRGLVTGEHASDILIEALNTDRAQVLALKPLTPERFPMFADDLLAMARNRDAPHAPGPAHVLWVDDEPAMVAIGRRALAGHDVQMTGASTLAEARRILSCGPVDVLVADAVLPDGYGIHLLERARSRHGSVVRAICSGRLDDDAVLMATDRGGVQRILHKPLEPNDIRRLVGSLVPRCADPAAPHQPGSARMPS